MRTTRLALALALGLVASVSSCSCSDKAGSPPAADAPTTLAARGPDLLVVRLPRAGGLVRAVAYPALDSVVWTAPVAAPAAERVLAFDENAGSLAAVATNGAPFRVDFRLGRVTRAARPGLLGLTSSDGWAIYGIAPAPSDSVVRLTPSGDWKWKPPRRAREVYPQPNGSLLVLADRGATTTIWRVRPPQTDIDDSATVPRATQTIRTQVGDRLYFAVDSGLIGVSGRDLELVPSLRLTRPPRAVVTTPSGDRIFVADGSPELVVIDRYAEAIDVRIEMPGPVSDLRIDPTGRFLLARPERGDSVWVVGVDTDSVAGAVRTRWRTDLPLVAPDGAIALLEGNEVVFVDGESLRELRRVADGGADIWHIISWNGFRRRAPAEDAALIAAIDSARIADSLLAQNPFAGAGPGSDSAAIDSAAADSASPPPPSRPEVVTRPQPTTRDSARPEGQHARDGFTLQLAAVRDEMRAQEIAADIGADLRDNQQRPRVVASRGQGFTVYKVVLGPFATRNEAEQVGRRTRRPYWVYPGPP